MVLVTIQKSTVYVNPITLTNGYYPYQWLFESWCLSIISNI